MLKNLKNTKNMITINVVKFTCIIEVEIAWRSGSVMDCHATARGSIPSGKGVFTELHVLRKGQLMGCRL